MVSDAYLGVDLALGEKKEKKKPISNRETETGTLTLTLIG
jgi:hypothetical protein